MGHIPLLAEEGAERERDSAKPQEWLRHQENAAKPQRRRRRARSRHSGQFGWPSKGCRTDHPVRDKSERIHFLMSRTHPSSASSARRGVCAPKTLSKKLEVATV